MFPEHLQAEWWEKPSRNRNDDKEKVIIGCQTKACQIALLTAPHTCPLIFLPLDLCSCAPEVWNGLLPPISQCQVLIILQDLAQILSVWIFPHIPTLAPHFQLFLPLWYSPRAPGFWQLLFFCYLSQLMSFLLGTHHLLPEILQLCTKKSACHQFFLPSVYIQCYCQRHLPEIHTTPDLKFLMAGEKL